MTRTKLVPTLVVVAAVAALVSSAAWAVGRGHMTWWGGRHATMMGVSSGSGHVENIGDARIRFTRVASREHLRVGEVMQFARNYYAELLAADGSRATEALLDPATGRVSTEYGPAMMWNTRYGHLIGTSGMMSGSTMVGTAGSAYESSMMGGGAGMMTGGMMRGLSSTQSATPAGTLSAGDALAKAQAWLDANQPGLRAADAADAFPGYFTIDITKDGKTTGMLSVNASTGQVWDHWWHGAFVGMSE
jgi:hypothetical protein